MHPKCLGHVTTTLTNIESPKRGVATAVKPIPLTPLNEPYAMAVLYDEGLHDSIISDKPTYCIWISISITSSSLMTVAILLVTGSSLNLVKKGIPLPRLKESIKSTKWPALRTSNREIANDEVIMLFILLCRDLHVRAKFGVLNILLYPYCSGCRLSAEAYAVYSRQNEKVPLDIWGHVQ